MLQPILSIVIPVYNVAAYLEKCVHSCFDQNVDKSLYEVILINDGSTDNSLDLCEKLKIQYPDINLISQENKGLSGARNTGLGHAIGEYVWFVDSDDWITENCLANIINQIEKYHTDVFWLGHDLVPHGKVHNIFIPNKIDTPISGEDFFANQLNGLFYIWKFIYKRDFLMKNKLEFYEGIVYEDLEFTPRALYLAKTCYTIPKVYYHYLIREGSIVNKIKLKNIEDRFLILSELSNILNDKSISMSFKITLKRYILDILNGTFKLATKNNIKIPESGFRIIDRIKNENLYNTNLTLTTRILIVFPNLYYLLLQNYYGFYKLLSLKK